MEIAHQKNCRHSLNLTFTLFSLTVQLFLFPPFLDLKLLEKLVLRRMNWEGNFQRDPLPFFGFSTVSRICNSKHELSLRHCVLPPHTKGFFIKEFGEKQQ